MQHASIKQEVEAIEKDSAGDDGEPVIEFVIPSTSRLSGLDDKSDMLGGDEDDDDETQELGVRFYVTTVDSRERAPLGADYRKYAVDELRFMADRLSSAADRIEAAAGGKSVQS